MVVPSARWFKGFVDLLIVFGGASPAFRLLFCSEPDHLLGILFSLQILEATRHYTA